MAPNRALESLIGSKGSLGGPEWLQIEPWKSQLAPKQALVWIQTVHTRLVPIYETDALILRYQKSIPFGIASESSQWPPWAPRAPKAPSPGGPKGPLGPGAPKGPLGPWATLGGPGGPFFGVPGPGSHPWARPGLLGIIETALRENCAASELRCEETALRANGSAGMRGA